MRLGNLDGRLVLVSSDGTVDVETLSGGRFCADPQGIYARWEEFRDWVASADADATQPYEPTRLGPPVPSPRQIFAIGLNYRDHVAETGIGQPTAPAVFTKFPTCLAGPHDPVVLPPGSVDWEVELVVVIGRRCERVAEQAAWSHVAGVMVGQDLSERQLQLAGPAPQFSLGKSFAGFGPVGPELVTIDELKDPNDLALSCRLENGATLQTGRTRDMIFPVPDLIARLSAVCPLLPGDLVFTGTPAGVGVGRKPPQFLQPGDVLISRIDGVGSLRNLMVTAEGLAALTTGAHRN